jgi:hypothetical protein
MTSFTTAAALQELQVCLTMLRTATLHQSLLRAGAPSHIVRNGIGYHAVLAHCRKHIRLFALFTLSLAVRARQGVESEYLGFRESPRYRLRHLVCVLCGVLSSQALNSEL